MVAWHLNGLYLFEIQFKTYTSTLNVSKSCVWIVHKIWRFAFVLFSISKWKQNKKQSNHLALQLNSLGSIFSILIDFDTVLKEVLLMALKISVYLKVSFFTVHHWWVSANSINGLFLVFQCIKISPITVLVSNWYQQVWISSCLRLVHANHSILNCALYSSPSPALLFCHVTRSIWGAFRERCVLQLKRDRLWYGRSITITSNYLSAHVVSREYLYWCLEPQHCLCNYLISAH